MRLMDTNFCTESATTVTASNIDSNFPVSNLKNPFRSKRVRTSVGTTTLTVVFDFQTTEAVDSVVLMWPKEDGIRLTGSATITVQANATNVWTSPSVSQALTIDDDYSLASHYFSTDKSYRYWRVVIADSGNPWDYVELGQVWIGKSLSIENAQNGFKFALADQSKITETDFGHRYADEYPQKATAEFTYAYLDYSAIQTLENAYRRNGNRKPVLLVIDADGTVFDKDHYTLYGNLGGLFSYGHVNYNLFNTDGIRIEELS